jgi:ABC-2 type transport system ATP-binding protein
MAQRLGIAAALLGDPAVLMLDEPVNGLDPDCIRWIRGMLKTLAPHGRTVLISSHLISEVAQTADQLIVIGRGRLLAQTTVAGFSARSGSLEEAFFQLTGSSTEYSSTYSRHSAPRRPCAPTKPAPQRSDRHGRC